MISCSIFFLFHIEIYSLHSIKADYNEDTIEWITDDKTTAELTVALTRVNLNFLLQKNRNEMNEL